MPEKRLAAIVTVLLFLTASPGAHADATFEQLLIIDRFLTAQDTKGLWAYLEENPILLEGEDELARELRKFHNSVAVGPSRFDFEPPAVQRSVSSVRGVSMLY